MTLSSQPTAAEVDSLTGEFSRLRSATPAAAPQLAAVTPEPAAASPAATTPEPAAASPAATTPAAATATISPIPAATASPIPAASASPMRVATTSAMPAAAASPMPPAATTSAMPAAAASPKHAAASWDDHTAVPFSSPPTAPSWAMPVAPASLEVAASYSPTQFELDDVEAACSLARSYDTSLRLPDYPPYVQSSNRGSEERADAAANAANAWPTRGTPPGGINYPDAISRMSALESRLAAVERWISDHSSQGGE